MSKQEYNGSELVVQALKELKVKYIFGYPGGSVLDLYDALFQQEDIEHILDWEVTSPKKTEVPFKPARVIL